MLTCLMPAPTTLPWRTRGQTEIHDSSVTDQPSTSKAQIDETKRLQVLKEKLLLRGLYRPSQSLSRSNDIAIMQLSVGRAQHIQCSQVDRTRPVVVCPAPLIAAGRAPIIPQRSSAAARSHRVQQEQSLRSRLVVRSTPLEAAPALKAPGQHLTQASSAGASTATASWRPLGSNLGTSASRLMLSHCRFLEAAFSC